MAQLSNARQAYLPAEMPADHPETCRATIHFVDLHQVVDFADALAAFAEQALLVGERIFFFFGFGVRPFTVQFHFVLHLCLRRKQFRCEIKRNTRFCFCLI